MYPASLVLKGKATLSGSEAHVKLSNLLLDEVTQVISSFELNQIASLTYGDLVCDEIFEFLEEILAHPIDHSPLCLQKALVITKHVLIYGSEKTVNSVWGLGRYINNLREYNTVLIAQQRQGPDAFWQRIKGGGVDKGFPVREIAEELNTLLQSREQIQMLRHTKADPNSLVPVGDDKIAFASDEVRHYLLKKRLEEQRLMHTKSNLKKERGGFGGGYQAKDGKQVVGAAHSLEEMIARANREKQKFTDDGPVHTQQQEQDYLSGSYTQPSAPAAVGPEVDLLDFSAPVSALTPAYTDPFGTADLLGANLQSSAAADSAGSSSVDATTDLLSLMTVAPTVPAAPTVAQQQTTIAAHDSFAPTPVPALQPESSAGGMKSSVMTSNVDRFAALDALASNDGKSSGSILTGFEAQNRILGSFNVNETNGKVQQTVKTNPQTLASIGGESITAMTNGLSSLPTVPPPVEEYVQPNFASISMGATYGDPSGFDDDDGFVMGGVAGSGLEPVAPPPAGAPPPPPPMY